jgi:PhnB protein
MADVQPIPDGYPRVMPYLIVDGGDAAIRFYTEVLGAKERMRMGAPGGRVGHAELEFGSSVVMLADEHPEMGARGPKSVGGSPVLIHLYVADVDAVFQAAVAAGATETRAVEDKFYGDRGGEFEDPFGHRWSLATHVEDVPPEEMDRRAAEMMSS